MDDMYVYYDTLLFKNNISEFAWSILHIKRATCW
jgi:hypothetical protein